MSKIAMIDDEDDFCELMKIELESEGYEVCMVSDSDKGLQLVKDEQPDLILLDIMMPGLDGYDLLKLLKDDSTTRDIPVVMLTAKGMENEIQKALDFGADDYVQKPFHSGLLLKRIKTLVDKKG